MYLLAICMSYWKIVYLVSLPIFNQIVQIIFLKIFFLYFLERREGRGKEKDRNTNV